MAQQVQIKYVDDMDGSEASGTVEFGLDGVTYQIDLSDENQEKLREILGAFVSHGRRVGGRKHRGQGPAAKRNAGGGGVDTQAVRVWARENGLTVSDRGRIPASIMEQYNAAQ